MFTDFIKYLFLWIPMILSCQSKSDPIPVVHPSTMPIIRPQNFSLSYSDLSNRNLYGEYLYVSAAECSYSKRFKGVTSEVKFTLPAIELDSIYLILREQQFDQIEMRREIVLDAGGSSLSIQCGDSTYHVNHDSGYKVKQEWMINWQASVGAAYRIIRRIKETHQATLKLSYDADLYKINIGISFEEHEIFRNDVSGRFKDRKNYKLIKCLPGRHLINYYDYTRSEFQEDTLSVSQSGTLLFKYVNNRLIIERL